MENYLLLHLRRIKAVVGDKLKTVIYRIFYPITGYGNQHSKQMNVFLLSLIVINSLLHSLTE